MNAIVQNKHIFKDKVVLDVGCGTAILSMYVIANIPFLSRLRSVETTGTSKSTKREKMIFTWYLL